MNIHGKSYRYEHEPEFKRIEVETDLYMLGIFVDGVLSDYVSSGRPCTYRVYNGLYECKNGIRGNRRRYRGELKPVRILTGEIVELEENA